MNAVKVSRLPDKSGDFVCDGIDDDVEIQAAIDCLNSKYPRLYKFLFNHLNFFGIFNFLRPKIILGDGIYNLPNCVDKELGLFEFDRDIILEAVKRMNS
jgi:hypothetical protein